METLEIHLQYSDANYIVMLRSRSILFQVVMRTRKSLIHSTIRYRKCAPFIKIFLLYKLIIISHTVSRAYYRIARLLSV